MVLQEMDAQAAAKNTDRMNKTLIFTVILTAIASPQNATAQGGHGGEGRRYVVTDYGVRPDEAQLPQTDRLQSVIDMAAADGGGVIVIPRGTYVSGSLFFRQGTHLRIEEGGTLKGIDDIAHYPIKKTRMEGQTLKYFSALVNADGIDGFSISGDGTIDGNGLRFWREFWLRREYNKECTNLEAMRPRLIYISNCKNVSIDGIRMQNSAFWTLHIYRSEKIRITNTSTFSPAAPVKAPSTDAIDLDNCRDVLIKGCEISVNDDAIALKGGKGEWADRDPDNGPNENIVVEDCDFGFVHSCLTLGSESVRDSNIVMRNCRVDGASRVVWLKFRPDTPQSYEDIRIEGITGRSKDFLVVRPWTQFYREVEREGMPISGCKGLRISGVKIECDRFWNVGASDGYELSCFELNDIDASAADTTMDLSMIRGVKTHMVKLTPSGKKTEGGREKAGDAE